MHNTVRYLIKGEKIAVQIHKYIEIHHHIIAKVYSMLKSICTLNMLFQSFGWTVAQKIAQLHNIIFFTQIFIIWSKISTLPHFGCAIKTNIHRSMSLRIFQFINKPVNMCHDWDCLPLRGAMYFHCSKSRSIKLAIKYFRCH